MPFLLVHLRLVPARLRRPWHAIGLAVSTSISVGMVIMMTEFTSVSTLRVRVKVYMALAPTRGLLLATML